MRQSSRLDYRAELACTTFSTVAALFSSVVPPTIQLNSMLDILMKDVSEILGLTQTSKRQELKEFGEYVGRVVDQVVSALRNDRLAPQPNVLKNLEELRKTLYNISRQISSTKASGAPKLMSRRHILAPEEDRIGRMRQQLRDALNVFQLGAFVELLAKSPEPPSTEAASMYILPPDRSQPCNASNPPTNGQPRTNVHQARPIIEPIQNTHLLDRHSDKQPFMQRARPIHTIAVAPRSSGGSEDSETKLALMNVERCRSSFRHSPSPTQKMALAGALDHLTELLAKAGQTNEALVTSQESAELYRSLAEKGH